MEDTTLMLRDTLVGIAERVEEALAAEYMRGYAAGMNHARGTDFISDKLKDVEVEE